MNSKQPQPPRRDMLRALGAMAMKSPFGAPFADEDIPAIVDYLVKTYGAE